LLKYGFFVLLLLLLLTLLTLKLVSRHYHHHLHQTLCGSGERLRRTQITAKLLIGGRPSRCRVAVVRA